MNNTTLKAICNFDIEDCENTLVAKAGEIVDIDSVSSFIRVRKSYEFGTGVLLDAKQASLLLRILVSSDPEKELSHV